MVPLRIGLTAQTTHLYSGPMNSDINAGGRVFWRIPTLVLLLVYFSQVCPPVHLHHDHDDHGHPFELNLHPIKANPLHLAAHEQDGHHHHSFREQIDWQRVRRLSDGLRTLTDLSSLCSGPRYEPYVPQKFTGWACAEARLPESIPGSPFDPRGPPARG